MKLFYRQNQKNVPIQVQLLFSVLHIHCLLTYGYQVPCYTARQHVMEKGR